MTRTQTHPIRLRWAIGLVVLGLLAVLLPTQRAAADHTPIPTAVTLVGSLQSELGCPGDWQPECAATHLEPVPGQPEVFRATFTVPAGSYEYKVALNNSWDENYGAGGAAGGANLPITSTGDPITFTYDHRTHVISDDTPRPLIADAAAHWLRRGTIAWDLPDSRDGFSYRLYWAAEGGLAEEDGEIVGGESVPLTVVAGGLARRPASAVPAPGRVRGPERSRRGPVPDRRHPHGADRGGLVHARGRAVRGDRRADPGGPRRGLRRGEDAYARPDLARRSAEPHAVGADGEECRPAADPRRLEHRAAGGDDPRPRRGVERAGKQRLAQRPLPLRGPGVRADHECGGDQPGHRPVLARADHQLRPLDPGRPGRPGPRARRLEPAAQAGAAQAGVLHDLRAARAGLLDLRRDRAGDPPRHLPGLHRPGQRRDAAPAAACPVRAEHGAPAAGQRHRLDRGGPGGPTDAGL